MAVAQLSAACQAGSIDDGLPKSAPRGGLSYKPSELEKMTRAVDTVSAARSSERSAQPA
jgi:hypothetical protein